MGSDSCRPCHTEVYETWKKTTMAQAMELLTPGSHPEAKKRAHFSLEKDYRDVKKCATCHATGAGKPGGYISHEITPDRQGVGCEECHGPGALYTDPESKDENPHPSTDAERYEFFRKPERACLKCHNGHRPFKGPDYKFEYKAEQNPSIHAMPSHEKGKAK